MSTGAARVQVVAGGAARRLTAGSAGVARPPPIQFLLLPHPVALMNVALMNVKHGVHWIGFFLVCFTHPGQVTKEYAVHRQTHAHILSADTSHIHLAHTVHFINFYYTNQIAISTMICPTSSSVCVQLVAAVVFLLWLVHHCRNGNVCIHHL